MRGGGGRRRPGGCKKKEEVEMTESCKGEEKRETAFQ